MIVVFFDAEEPPHFLTPCMGSRRFYEDQLDDVVHAAFVMDLVGHDVSIPLNMAHSKLPSVDVPVPRLRDVLFLTGAESHPGIARLAEAVTTPGTLRPVFALNEYVGDMSDHEIFRKSDVPYLFLSCGRWAHYHMPSDTPDRLNYEKMKCSSLKRALGPTWRLIVRSLLGIDKLDTREDMDRIARALMETGV